MLVGTWRQASKKYIDPGDLVAMIEATPRPDLAALEELGDLAHADGGREILVLARDARAGHRLRF